MKNKERINNKFLKISVFSIISLILVGFLVVVNKEGKMDSLEGYMYSLVANLSSATQSNATTSNATSCNATSSNATSSNATSSNVNNTNTNNRQNNTNEQQATTQNTNITIEKNNEVIENKEEIKNNEKVEVGDESTEKKTVEYENSKLTDGILNEIKSSSDIKTITINVDTDTVIKKELFNSIKGLDKELIINSNNTQLIFNGKDIKKIKDIDVEINYTKLSENEELNEYANNGIVINFKPNGDLPGKAKVRIKATDGMKKVLSKDSTMYVYYYNSDTKEFETIASNVKYKDGEYIEFNITHNSVYIITTSKIDTAKEENVNDEKVSFLESNKVYILIIGVSIILIITVVVIIIVYNRKKKRAKSPSNINKDSEDKTQNKKG